MGTMQNILPWCLDMKEMTLRLKFDQKRLNSEIWVLWKLPKNSKQLFRSQLKWNMNFWLLWWLDLIEIDMKRNKNDPKRAKNWNLGNFWSCPKVLEVAQKVNECSWSFWVPGGLWTSAWASACDWSPGSILSKIYIRQKRVQPLFLRM